MSNRILTAEVTDVHGGITRSEVAADLAHGGYKVVLTNDATATHAPGAWLPPSEARQLINHLMAQAEAAEARNLAEYGDKDGPRSSSTRDDIGDELRARQRRELIERQAAERKAQGLELYPLATWHAASPDQLADVITGVTRSDPAFGRGVVLRMIAGEDPFEFGTERRDPSGALVGGALWRAERAGVSSFRLHLLQSEPGGVA